MTPAGIGYPSATTVTAPDTRPAYERPKTDREKDEMKRAAARIYMRGGTDEDVASFFFHGYGVKLPGYEPTNKDAARMPGTAEGWSMNALQGVTFGFGDEAVGSMVGLLTGKTAQEGRDEYRAEMDRFNEGHVGRELAGNVAGGLLLAPILAPYAAVKGLSLAGKALKGAKIGGAAGTLAGAGNAEGGLSERSKGAVVGGALGATVGAALPVVGTAVGTVTKPLRRTATTWVEKLYTPQTTTASKAAREYWAQAITRDHGSIENAIKKAEQMSRTGAPVSLADVAGENGLDLVQAASGLRGPGKQKMVEELLTRQADQGDRLLGKLFRSLKVGTENAYDAADELMAGRKAASSPLYQEAYTQETKVTEAIAKILNHPRFQKAYEVGRLIASDEDLAGVANQGALKVGPLALDEKTGKFIGETISVRALDYLKRGLDVAIEQDVRSGAATLDKQSGRALRKLLGDALDSIEDVPAYKRARGVWRGETEALEALNLGKGGAPLGAGAARSPRFVGKPPEIIARELRDLTPQEQELYKLGAAQDVAEYLAETTASAGNAAKKLGGKSYGTAASNIEKRVRALFGKDMDGADEFMDYVKAESRLSQTTGKLSGSRTAPMQNMMAELQGSTPGKGGILSQVAGATISALTNKARTGWTDAISDEISALALRGSAGPEELIAALNSLRAYQPKYRPLIPVYAGQAAGRVP